jgi:hypothetical protein
MFSMVGFEGSSFLVPFKLLPWVHKNFKSIHPRLFGKLTSKHFFFKEFGFLRLSMLQGYMGSK